MGRVADEEVLPGGEVAAEPIPEETTVDPQNLDVDSFQQTAGPVRRGLRSGFNQVGAMANAFASSVGESVGLTDFAARAMRDAEDQVIFADRVGPRIRDYRAVKDFADLQEFVLGLVGQNVATMAPAVAGAVVGRGAAGLRGAYGGAALGSFVPNAGEQALRIKDTKATPAEKLGNVVSVGAASSALDMLAPGSVVGKVGKGAAKGSIVKEALKTAGVEGVTEGAQEAIGQAGHTVLDPLRDKGDDTAEIVNSAIAGAVGGGVLGGAGQTVSKVAGKLDTSIKGIQQSKKDVEKALEVERKPVDEFDDSDLLDNPDLNTEDDLLQAIEEKGAKSVEALAQLWERVKDDEKFKPYKDFATDPEVRAEFINEAKKRFDELEVKPKLKKWLDNTGAFVKGMKGEVEKRAGKKAKESKMRTAVDFEIYDNMLKRLPKGLADSMTPQQKLELADHLKYVAMYEYGKRDPEEGPRRPAFSNEEKGAAREQDPTTRRRTVPEGLLHYFGKDAVSILNETNDIVANRIEPSIKRDFTQDVVRTEQAMRRRDNVFQATVRSNLRPEIQADPDAREEAVNFAEKIYDMVESGKFNEDQLNYLFEPEAKQRVLDRFDNMRQRLTVEPDTFFLDDQDIADLHEAHTESVEVADEQAEGGFRAPTVEETKRDLEEAGVALGDKRIGVPTDYETVQRWFKQLTDPTQSEYDPRRVSFTIQQTQDGRYEIEAKDRIADDSFTDQEWQDVREPEEHGKSGLKNGIMTVTLKDGRQNKINLVRLTRHAMRTTPREDVGDVNYVYDMVSRGLAKLLADPKVKGLNQFTEAQIIKGPQAWDLPDNTPVAYFQKRLWTWGEVKEKVKVSSDELRIKRITLNSVEAAEEADSIEDIEQRILSFVTEQRKMYEAHHQALSMQIAKLESTRKYVPGKLKGERDKLGNWVSRLRNAEDRVMAEVERRVRDGDLPRSEIKGLVEDERIRSTTHAETPLGLRTVEADTGIPTQTPVNRGPAGELDAGIPDRDKQSVKGSYQGKVISENEFRDEKDFNEELKDQRTERNPQTPSTVRDKGPLVDPNLPSPHTPKPKGKTTEQPMVLPIEMESDFRVWLSSNEGKTVMDYLKDKVAYTGKGKKGKELQRQAAEVLRKLQGLKFSTQNVGTDGFVPAEERTRVKNELQRILGPDLVVKFMREMRSAGSFIKDDNGIETVRIHAKALDAMGVGRHEAAHALFERLVEADPKMAQTLLAAAGSPTIITRLRTLLQGHPGALEQLSDPEERLAYMYQFWAADLLRVGPNTRTAFDKVKGFFRRVAGIWSETFKHVENMDKAERVFELFQQGHFADKNTIRQVLEREFPKTPFQRATELWPAATRFFSKALLTADGRIRNTNIPAFVDIADKFYTPVGEQDKGPGFLQTRYMVLNRLHNKLHDIMENVNEADHSTILAQLRSGQPTTHPAARAIQEILNEVFRYMNEKGVKVVEWSDEANGYVEHPLKFVQNYFPRYYDRQKIFDDQEGFIRVLTTSRPDANYRGMPLEEAQRVMAQILRSTRIDPQENDYSAGLTFFAPNAQHRTLSVPDSVLAPYLQQDLMGTLYSYLNYTTRRAEYASRFGNQGQVIEEAITRAREQGASVEDIKTFNQSVMALEGSLGFDIKPELKQILGGIVTYQNYRLLPLALLTSLVDSIGIGVRGGGVNESFSAFVRGVRELFKESQDDAYHLAKTVGTIAASNDAHMLADAYGTQYLTGWQRKANNLLFKWNGMEQWNRSMRVAATAAAERFIIRHATSPTEHSERYLRELGLTVEDVRIDGGSLVLDEKTKQAVAQWVDGAILRPNAAIRPVWMSDPHWMLIAHLKQFTYSFQKIIIARVVHEIENGNFTPAYYILSYVPMIIASDVLRMIITPGQGDDDKLRKYTALDWLNRGVQRAGLLGPGQYAVDAYGDLGHGKIPVTSFAGPSAQQLWDMGAAFAGHGSFGLEMKKAVPGYMLVR